MQDAAQALKGLVGAGAGNIATQDVPLSGVDLPFKAPPYCGDFQIHIARDGTWFYQNSPIGRKALCKLFATVLHCDDSGGYWLITPAERGKITVEVAPFTFVEYRKEGDWLEFRTNLDEWVRLDDAHPLEVGEEQGKGASQGTPQGTPQTTPLPLMLVRGRLKGLLVRSLFYQLVDIAQMRNLANGKCELYIVSGNLEFSLGQYATDM